MSYGSRVTLTVATGLITACVAWLWYARTPPEPTDDDIEEVEPQASVEMIKENEGEEGEEVKKIATNVDIYYASQTGTAERMAKTLATFLAKWDPIFKSEAINIEEWEEKDFLQGRPFAIFLVSTHDDGLFPDNAMEFVKWLREFRDKQHLDHVSFCIFGLGSTEYAQFNMAAKKLQSILKKLGAHEFMPITLGDDAVDLKSDFQRWKNNLCHALSKELKLKLPALEETQRKLIVAPNDSWRNRASLELRYLDELGAEQEFEPKMTNVVCKQQWLCSDHVVLENVCLTPKGDGQTHCVILESRERFMCAETVNVLYANPPEVVEYFANRLNITDIDMKRIITFVPRYGKRGKNETFDAPFPVPCTIRDALHYYLDLTTFPNVEVLSDMGTFLRNAQECERLNRILTSDALLKRMKEELYFTLPEFVEVFMPGVQFNLGGFLQLVPLKMPRPYTIASHPKTGKIALTVKLVQFATHSLKNFKKTIEHGFNYQQGGVDESVFRKRRFYKGACTHFLCALNPGDIVKMYRRPSVFSVMEGLEDRQIVMIANGAGIAPFRAIWQNENSERCRILFFGCRDADHMLYKNEIEALKTKDNFTVHIAFSRDKDHIYVQHMVRTHITSVCDVIRGGGVICVCGSKQMGAQLKAIIERFINTDIATLKERGQYIEEMW